VGRLDTMKKQKNPKEWQSILLWSLVISGLLFFTLVTCSFSDHCTKQEEWIYFAFVAFFVLWGGVLGILYTENRVKKILEKFVIIRRPLSTLVSVLFLFSVMISVLWSFIDPMRMGTFAYKAIITLENGLSFGNNLITIPFIIGYFVGFIPTFFIHHTLKLYRKHLKHILELC